MVIEERVALNIHGVVLSWELGWSDAVMEGDHAKTLLIFY
jgi:hypothetical protein